LIVSSLHVVTGRGFGIFFTALKFFCETFYSRIDNTRLNFRLDTPEPLQVEKFWARFRNRYAFD
jgi:hypothetical protein